MTTGRPPAAPGKSVTIRGYHTGWVVKPGDIITHRSTGRRYRVDKATVTKDLSGKQFLALRRWVRYTLHVTVMDPGDPFPGGEACNHSLRWTKEGPTT